MSFENSMLHNAVGGLIFRIAEVKASVIEQETSISLRCLQFHDKSLCEEKMVNWFSSDQYEAGMKSLL